MSALRSAISYIKSLQSLVADCDAGKLGDEVYTDSRRLDSVTSLGETEVRAQGRGLGSLPHSSNHLSPWALGPMLGNDAS